MVIRINLSNIICFIDLQSRIMPRAGEQSPLNKIMTAIRIEARLRGASNSSAMDLTKTPYMPNVAPMAKFWVTKAMATIRREIFD